MKNRLLILLQFFLIIFVYHLLKDLKDSLVITASDAGAEVIPFIKIWGMLPLALLVSYLFTKLYHRFGREKTLYIFLSSLLGAYLLFAFCLYPMRESLFLHELSHHLIIMLPAGSKGFVAMICYWIYTLFYLSAELWSILMLSILFWGYVNEVTSFEEAKSFYPICTLVGNCAGILSGQTSHYLSHTLVKTVSWQNTLQLMIVIVAFCGFAVMVITRLLALQNESREPSLKKEKPKYSFKECISAIFQSRELLCIASIVVGYALTSNLIEVAWKDCVRAVYPTPQAYNAYINQLTSIVGLFSVVMALTARWLFQKLSWSTVALISPIALFITSSLFFSLFHLPEGPMEQFATQLGLSTAALIMTAGSCYYVVSLTAKYTLFDTCKEMAFLSIDSEKRMKAKAVIDSLGSRLGNRAPPASIRSYSCFLAPSLAIFL